MRSTSPIALLARSVNAVEFVASNWPAIGVQSTRSTFNPTADPTGRAIAAIIGLALLALPVAAAALQLERPAGEPAPAFRQHFAADDLYARVAIVLHEPTLRLAAGTYRIGC